MSITASQWTDEQIEAPCFVFDPQTSFRRIKKWQKELVDTRDANHFHMRSRKEVGRGNNAVFIHPTSAPRPEALKLLHFREKKPKFEGRV